MSIPTKIHLDIGFAKFELYENYLIATVNEGVVLEAKEMEKFHEVFENHYSNRPFGYISNRKHDYTINPTYYKEIEKFNIKLVGIATLCYSEASYKMANFAEQFFTWPHKAFYSRDECIEWINQLVEEVNSNN
jgi:hypothetical protein